MTILARTGKIDQDNLVLLAKFPLSPQVAIYQQTHRGLSFIANLKTNIKYCMIFSIPDVEDQNSLLRLSLCRRVDCSERWG